MKEFVRGQRNNYGSFIVDRLGTILGFDRAMESLTGWAATEIVGQNKELGEASRTYLSGANPILSPPLYEGRVPSIKGSRSMELVIHGHDGRSFEAETVVKRLDGPGERMLVSILEVMARSAEERVLGGGDRRDSLTALPDREAFAGLMEAEIRAASKQSRPLALMLIDVDHLREINDRHGHADGDEVLKKVAGILRVSVDDEMCIARLGADDFAVLLRDSGRGEARQLAAGIRSTVERYRFFNEPSAEATPQVTVSIGAASFPADAESEQELVDRAQEALAEARAMGRNRVWCYLRRPRVPLEVPVYFDGADPQFVGYTRDLSPSGIFLQTSAEIDVGMRCALTFPIPGHEGRVHVVGRIVRTVHTQFAETNDNLRVPGLGVEFESFNGTSDRRAIESYLHHHESESLRPELGPLSF